MSSIEQWQNREFLIFWNSKQKAYHIESIEELRLKPPMADGWKVVARAKGWMAAAAVVEQRSKEGVDR